MELVIPDGAQVHITIGNGPVLALPNEHVPQPTAQNVNRHANGTPYSASKKDPSIR